MGVVFALIFFVGALAAGTALLILGIVGIAVLSKKKGSGALKGLSIASTAVGGVLMCVPIVFFLLIGMINLFAMDSFYFVDTGVYIEEEGYQGELFTVDGVTYECVDEIWTDPEGREAVYCYKSDGFMSGGDRGNYYRVENDGGFDLVCCEYGSLFCPTEQYEEVYNYYTDESNLIWCVDGGQPLSEDMSRRLDEFIDKNKSTEYVTADEIIEIKKQTPDGVVYTDWWDIAVGDDGGLYLAEYYESGMWGTDKYVASRLPDDLAKAIIEANK